MSLLSTLLPSRTQNTARRDQQSAELPQAVKPAYEVKETPEAWGVTVHLPGRALVSASLVFPVGVVDEPAELGGATVLAAASLAEVVPRIDPVRRASQLSLLGWQEVVSRHRREYEQWLSAIEVRMVR